MRQSTFTNWHKPSAHYRVTDKPLSNCWPVMVHRVTAGVDVIFSDAEGRQIQFKLDERDARNLLHGLKQFLER